MKKITFKSITLLFTAFLFIFLISITPSAKTYIGNCGKNGDNATFTLDMESGVLEINGTGAIADYDSYNSPWNDDKDKIKAVKISESIEYIGKRAFAGCINLTSVHIPDSVEAIGEMAFFGCESLEKVTIPIGVKSIGHFAFLGCESLKNVTISKSLQKIDDSFAYCKSLTEFKVDEDNPAYCDSEGILFSKDMKELISYPALKQGEEYAIPSSVVSVENFAFYNAGNLKKITFGKNLKVIGERAFLNCYSLEKVDIPDSVTEIGSEAFGDCRSLKNAKLPEGITSIGDYCFQRCDRLIDINIPKSVTYIGVSAFEGCTDLMSIVIPENVTTIGDYAFSGCQNMKNIIIPEKVTSIGIYAFIHCRALESVTISEGVQSIGDAAFHDCTKLTKINIPASVTHIDPSAFRMCDKLSEILVDGSNPVYCDIGGVLFSKDKKTIIMFPKNNTSSYTVPDGVTHIGASAFSGCDALTSVILPKSLEEIGKYAFSGCRSISNMAIPENVKLICGSAFSNCIELKNLIIKSKNIVFNYRTYDSCIEFDGIFENCDKLTTIYLYRDSNASEYFKNKKISQSYLDDIKLGDIDRSGSVNTRDALLLAKYLERNGNGVDNIAADCNLDGNIDRADLDILSLYLACCKVALG